MLRLRGGSLCYLGFALTRKSWRNGSAWGGPADTAARLRIEVPWLQLHFCCKRGEQGRIFKSCFSGETEGLDPSSVPFPTQHQEKNSLTPMQCRKRSVFKEILRTLHRSPKVIAFRLTFKVSIPFIYVVEGFALDQNP